LQANGTDLGTIGPAPYESSWTPPDSLIGQTATLEAIATNEAGQTTTASETVDVVAPSQSATNTGTGTGTQTSTNTQTGVGGTTTTTTTVSTTATVGSSTPPRVSLPARFLTAAAKGLKTVDLTPTVIPGSSSVVAVKVTLDGRTICTERTAPFTCVYHPEGADPGTDTMIVVAAAQNGQDGQVSARVKIDRLAARLRVRAKARSAKSLAVSGSVVLPKHVTAAEGCHGSVRIRLRSGKATLAGPQTLDLRGKCTFAGRLATRASKGELEVTFSGNAALAPERAHKAIT
jgi:hypothetical protein